METLGAVLLSGGFTAAVISGFVLYLANHGVDPVPNPTPPGAPNRAEREAHFQRYNARYVTVTRIVFRIASAVGVIGLLTLLVGVAGS